MRLLRNILFILFFLIGSAHADDSLRLKSYPPQKIMGFRGLDTQSKPPMLEDGRATDLQNVTLSSAFDLRKRYGYSVINDTLDDLSFDSPAVTGIYQAEFSGDTELFVFVGDKLKYDNAGTWTDVTTHAHTITSGQNNQWVCVTALDEAVCTNDVDLPIKIDTTPRKKFLDVSDLTDTLTKAKAVAWFRNYLILGNTVENTAEKPTRVRWSNVGTIETWTDADYTDIGTLAGDEITAFKELYGDLYAFCEKSIWKITLVGGDDVFSFNKVIDGVGAISKHSVQTVLLPNNQYGIIFLDRNEKIYLFNGLAVLDIGARIQETIDALSEARLEYAVAVYDDKSYYLAATSSGGSENDIVLEYQVEIGEWTKHTQIDANAFARVFTSSDLRIYFGNQKAFVYRLNDPDKKNDVDGATGISDSATKWTHATTITGATILIDATLPTGIYTGATVRITSGTGSEQEKIVVDHTATYLVVDSAFSTALDNTSVYSIGAIDAYYQSKWYDWGDSPRRKNLKELYFWAAEDSSNNVTTSHFIDFGSELGSSEVSLSPSAGSLWDSAVWDESVWGTTGNKMYRKEMDGVGRFAQVKFANSDIDETFHIYGFNILAELLDVR